MKTTLKFPFEILVYPFLVITAMWIIYWGEFVAPFDLTHLGILPRTSSGLTGVLFAPLLHSTNDIKHILNNSIPTFFLLMALFYFYKQTALKVIGLGWLLTGLLTWIIAKNEGSYHIGMSGIIYALVFFLFISGVLKKEKQYQAISLLIVILYGSLIWGIFPMEDKVSWEGHLGGTISGIFLAFYYFEKPSIKQVNSVTNEKWNDINYIQNQVDNYYTNQSISNNRYTTNYEYISAKRLEKNDS
jgi:membrane associated rhomboid family serine protease